MLAITVKQPWAEMLVRGAKVHEYRAWKTDYRGRLLIHAGRAYPTRSEMELFLEMLPGANKPSMYRAMEWVMQQGRGCIIGEVEIVGVREISAGHPGYRFGRYAWVTANAKKYDCPIWAVGKLGLWEYEKAT
jgi:hypothetical protein